MGIFDFGKNALAATSDWGMRDLGGLLGGNLGGKFAKEEENKKKQAALLSGALSGNLKDIQAAVAGARNPEAALQAANMGTMGQQIKDRGIAQMEKTAKEAQLNAMKSREIQSLLKEDKVREAAILRNMPVEIYEKRLIEQFEGQSSGVNPNLVQSTGPLYRDKKTGHIYQATTVKGNTSGLIPQTPGAPDPTTIPISRLEIIESSQGQSTQQTIEQKAGIAREEKFEANKAAVVKELPVIGANIKRIKKLLELAKEVNESGFSQRVQNSAADFFGTMPANDSEFRRLLGEQVRASARQFTDSQWAKAEMDALLTILDTTYSSPEAREAALEQGLRDANEKLEQAKLIMTSSNSGEYNAKLLDYMSEQADKRPIEDLIKQYGE